MSSRLQEGAAKLAENRKLGVVKFDVNGLEVVLDRTGKSFPEQPFIQSQIYQSDTSARSLKFSAFLGGRFYGSRSQFIGDAISTSQGNSKQDIPQQNSSDELEIGTVPYMLDKVIWQSAQEQLMRIGYLDGPVDLNGICLKLDINLNYSDEVRVNVDGKQILGLASFNDRIIQIFRHESEHRQRFTISHEIGHFCLQHDRYLLSESIVEQDLFEINQSESAFNFQRLECQANIFASDLLLPIEAFRGKIEELRRIFDIQDRGHGYIFVDDQPCNYIPYGQLLSEASNFFQVSKKAVEVKLSRLRMLTDQRIKFERVIRANPSY